jgi:hypothetical protein
VPILLPGYGITKAQTYISLMGQLGNHTYLLEAIVLECLEYKSSRKGSNHNCICHMAFNLEYHVFPTTPCLHNTSLYLTTLTPKTESMFHLVSFHAPYFENEWANSK